MKPVCLHSKARLEAYFRGNPALHIYGLGDLDDAFWNNTVWYGLEHEDDIAAVAFLYTGGPSPALLAISQDSPVMRSLLHAIAHLLPSRFSAHLSPGVEETLKEYYDLSSQGEHRKMVLTDPKQLEHVDCSQTEPLAEDAASEVLALFMDSSPDNWFDPRMLAVGQCYGVRADGRLVSVAGTHVYSERYRVAALGNITTHPVYRNRGYARAAIARLCRSLGEHTDYIGLNVKADNEAAIACYQKLGFEFVASYGEYAAASKWKSMKV